MSHSHEVTMPMAFLETGPGRGCRAGFILSALLALAFTPSLFGQGTRAETIEEAREQKGTRLKPDTVSSVERFLRDFNNDYLDVLTTGYHGFRPKLGGMVNIGGPALGVEFLRKGLLDGRLNTTLSAQTSTRGYQKYEAQAALPKLAKGRISAELFAVHRNYPSMHYYGSGPHRPKELRTNYRLDDTSTDAILAVQALPRLKVGGSAGYLWTNVGPGDDRRYISAERVFTPSQAPAINYQTNYVRNSVFAEYDYRDNPDGMSKSGGRYAFQQSWFHDQRARDYSFRRTEIDLQQFIPLFNKARIIALRANAALTETDSGQQVPFFLQPTLGGADELRGYRPFRFSDRNRMFMNAEYRWEIFSGLDGAVFAEAGKVFPRRGMLNFRDLESTVGFGLRFNIRNTNLLRFDTGFSHEGFQFWIRFSDVFRWRRLGTTVGREVY